MYIRKLFVLLTCFIAFVLFNNSKLLSQTKAYRVFYYDKGPEKFIKVNPIYDSTFKLYNNRAIKRRMKVMPPDSLFSIEDAPVYFSYTNKLSELGAKIKFNLRWNNYSVIECDSALSEEIKKLPFVKKVQPASSKLNTLSIPPIEYRLIKSRKNQILSLEQNNCDKFDYGLSFEQANVLNVPLLHSMGILGQGALVGFLDNGFRWRFHESTKNANVLSEYDFVYMDSSTANDNNDVFNQDGHGTLVFSTVAGLSQGQLIGIAPGAQFILAKTEDMRSETHIEEDNYAAAIEWMESLGVDVTSSSLGYHYFDSTDINYDWVDLDGKTTIAAQALNNAVKRGVICITAAGNRGPGEYTLETPGDADSALTIAAVYIDSTKTIRVANFSSRGRNASGKLKPDLAALGGNVISASTSGVADYISASGTSLSTPLIAGATALLISEFPELKPWEVRQILYSAGSQSINPDSVIGYGIPDMYRAMKSAGIIISPIASYPIKQFQRIASNIISKPGIIKAEANFLLGNQIDLMKFEMYKLVNSNQYIVDILLNLFQGKPALGYIIADNGISKRRMPFDSSKFFIIYPDSSIMPCGIDESAFPSISDDVQSAYLYPNIINEGIREIELNVVLNDKSGVNCDIYTVLGEKIFSMELPERNAGIANMPIQINNLSSGLYFVRIKYLNRIEVLNFIVNY